MQKLHKLISKNSINLFSKSSLIHIVGIVTGFLVGVVLARSLGVSGYGLYGSCVAIASLAATISAGGIQLHATREIAFKLARNNFFSVSGIIIWSIKNSLLLASISAFAITLYMSFFLEKDITVVMSTVLLTLSMSLLWIFAAIIRGSGSVYFGQSLDAAVRPTLQVLLISCYVILFNGTDVGIALFLSALAVILSIILGIRNVRKLLIPKNELSHVNNEKKVWRKDSITMGLSTIFRSAESNLPLILIGIMATMEEAGLFRISTAVMLIPSLSINIITIVVPAMIASMFAKNQLNDLRKFSSSCSLIMFISTFFFVLILFIFGEFLLSFIFGKPFAAASNTVNILSLSVLIWSIQGISTSILHGAKVNIEVTKAMGVSLMSIIIFIFILSISVEVISSEAMALAVLLATLIRTIMLIHATKKIIGIDPSILSFMFKK